MSHSDDLMWFGTSKVLIDKFINLLRNKVPMTPTTYSPSIFRGIEIIYHRNGDITLHQAAYIKEFIKKFNLENRKTPIVPGREMDQTFQPAAVLQASKKIIKEYMVRQGCLQWASLCSPSCAYVINWLARYMQNPQHHHIKQQESCLLYMVSIADKGITYVRQGPVQQFRKGFNMDCLLGYGDATWADIVQITLMRDLLLVCFGKLTKVHCFGTLVNKITLLCPRVSQKLWLTKQLVNKVFGSAVCTVILVVHLPSPPTLCKTTLVLLPWLKLMLTTQGLVTIVSLVLTYVSVTIAVFLVSFGFKQAT